LKNEEQIIAAIIESAKKLFQQFGLQKTTMADIAKKAGKGKSTLYYYFKSKDEIFEVVVKEEMNEVFNAVRVAVNRQKNTYNKLRAFVETRLKEVKNKATLYSFTIEYDDYALLSNYAAKLNDYFYNQEFELISGILIEALEKENFKLGLDKVEAVTDIFIKAVRGIEIDLIRTKEFDKTLANVDVYIDVMINGIKHADA
jgi:AcrR family transcriptional regulator